MASSDLQIDPRSPRLGAVVPLVLSASAIVLGLGTPALVVLAVLAVLFAPGAIIGPQATLQGWIFRKVIRPRLQAPKETESFRPPRFAQQVGIVFTLAAIAFGLAGSAVGFFVFAGFVLAASFLNAVFNFCLGCEMYLLFKRVTTKVA